MQLSLHTTRLKFVIVLSWHNVMSLFFLIIVVSHMTFCLSHFNVHVPSPSPIIPSGLVTYVMRMNQ